MLWNDPNVGNPDDEIIDIPECTPQLGALAPVPPVPPPANHAAVMPVPLLTADSPIGDLYAHLNHLVQSNILLAPNFVFARYGQDHQPLWRSTLTITFAGPIPALLQLDRDLQALIIDSEFRAAQKNRVKDNSVRVLYQHYPNLAML